MKLMDALTVTAAAALLLPAAGNAQRATNADADTFRLAPVVVTATRLPTPITEAPGSITVISGEELRARGVRTVADAVRLAPGVAVAQSGGPGGLSAVFMRGGESDYVQVLVDGVQANEPGGAFNWAHLDAADIDRIEIVRGPASVLYGSDAVAGVVQVFTRSGGEPRIQAGATTRSGSRIDSERAYRTHTLDASLAGGMDVIALAGTVLDYGVNASRTSSTGMYAFNSDYGATTASTRLNLRADRGDVALSARLNDNTYHYPTTGSGAVVDPNQFATGRSWSLGADLGYRVVQALELRLHATSYRTDSRTEDPADHDDDGSFWSTGELVRDRVDARANWRLGAMTLSTGVDRQWQHGTTELESVSEWGVYTDETDDRRTNTGGYAQIHGVVVPGVAITLGGRLDRNSVFGSFATGRAAASWAPAAGTRVHAAAGTAFKEPTFFETYAVGFTRGNPDLQPEESFSWEAGLEHGLLDGRISGSATLFRQRFRNLIQYTAAPPSETAPHYNNVGSASANGLELGAAADLTPRLALNGHYTLTRTNVTDEGYGTDVAFRQGERLLRRPEHLVTVGATLRATDALRAMLDVRHVGEREDLDFTDPARWEGIRTTLDAYTTVDAGAELGLFRRSAAAMTVTLRVRNVFDTDYVEIYNFPRPGRVFELGGRTRVPLR
ncbi:MAG TPA: TonB-dependent receptor [Longimicrobiales bacterium]|nr:TonB-dependent receptor [Longimicrobiales bacterium]